MKKRLQAIQVSSTNKASYFIFLECNVHFLWFLSRGAVGLFLNPNADLSNEVNKQKKNNFILVKQQFNSKQRT